ncbi:MAG TPA: polysaccharide deacetylase family protein [Intrasporangiaceae bacterium]|nr:polysaccharide deacetylase family protein [Intrasporangiaceae bacterium]
MIGTVLVTALLASGCGSSPDPVPTAQAPQPTPSATAPASTSPAGTPTTTPTPTTPTQSPTLSPTTPAVTTSSVTTTAPSPTPPPAPPTRTPTPSRTTPPKTTPPKTTPPSTPATCGVGALAGKDLERLPTTRKVVALTFDGGASNAGAQRILDTLAAHDVPATFFLTGRFAQTYPGLSRTIGSRYPVGNHSQSHPDLTTLSRAAAVDEIRAGRASIKQYAGVESRPLFRFPFGARNATVIGLVNDECYVAYRWTVDTLGWKGTSGGMSAATVHDRVLDSLQPGQIVLMHLGAHPQDGSTLDADALPRIIESIRARDYTFVTLTQ